MESIDPCTQVRSEFSSAQSCPTPIMLALLYLKLPIITIGGIVILHVWVVTKKNVTFNDPKVNTPARSPHLLIDI